LKTYFASGVLEGSSRKPLSPIFSPNRYVANLYAKTPLKMFSKLPRQKECCAYQPIEFYLKICHALASNLWVSALWQQGFWFFPENSLCSQAITICGAA
jgi:hypothetical protein|tara:strand:- start:295 stop:591 length:297 start_codon:yes stop_codon:yes gene_type:complete